MIEVGFFFSKSDQEWFDLDLGKGKREKPMDW